MTTSFEDRLRRSMERGATSVEAPAPPDLRAEARRRSGRRRSAVAVLGSAALVAAIVAVPQVWERRSPEAPPATPSRSARLALSIEDLPKGEPPQLYIADGALALPRTMLIPARDLVVAAGTALVEGRPGDWHVRRLADPYERVFDIPELVDRPALSSDGRLLAWAEPADGGTYRIVLLDVAEKQPVGSTEVGVGLFADFRLIGVDDSGRVYWSGTGEDSATTYLWSRTTGTRQVVMPTENARISQIAGETVVLDRVGLFGVIEGEATIRVTHRVVDRPIADVSPDGSRYVTYGGTVRPVDGVGEVRFLLDGSLHPRVIGFEDEAAVLVSVSKHDREAVARCSVRTGACERALDVTPGTALVLPR